MMLNNCIIEQLVKTGEIFFELHQKVSFWKITPFFILKLKLNSIPIGGQQYLSANYVFLLHFQLQTWKAFFSQMNSIELTWWSQLVIYSLNILLCIRVSGLTLFTGNMSKNVWKVDSGKASVRCQKNKSQKY